MEDKGFTDLSSLHYGHVPCPWLPGADQGCYFPSYEKYCGSGITVPVFRDNGNTGYNIAHWVQTNL
jgi:hypothetical protein